MKKAKKYFYITLVILLAFLALFIYWRYYFTYSEGYRAGLLQKISYKGNMIKTWEGEMILSSIESNKNTAIASEKFYFSVPDKAVADQVMRLEGYTVTLHYRQTHGILFWRGETNYLVDSVIVMK
jgi:hypothetical protein